MGQSFLLTPQLAGQAVDLAKYFFLDLGNRGFTNRDELHIVVMDPAAIYSDRNIGFEGAILYEESIGDPSIWEYDYKSIARAKACQAWKFGIPNQIIVERMPYLLKGHDTRYFGSAVKDGIVVAASGVQLWMDQLISEVVASTCQAFCIDVMKEIQKKDEGDTLDGRALPITA